MKYSVLMSVYKNENAVFLRESIESILNQTIKTDDFVIVWDGPLTLELESVLETYKIKLPHVFRFLKLGTNVGLGEALNQGVKFCRHQFIARMDSDDIAVPERMEWQLKLFEQNPQLSLCGGQIAEFYFEQNNISKYREVPCRHNEIYAYAKKRNPMNHMTTMFRKNAVLDVGNYIHMDMAEDYYLWVRMLIKGYQVQNIPKVLVKARIGNGMFDRRGGIQYAQNMYQLMSALHRLGFINTIEFIKGLSIRIILSLVPSCTREVIYEKLLRK